MTDKVMARLHIAVRIHEAAQRRKRQNPRKKRRKPRKKRCVVAGGGGRRRRSRSRRGGGSSREEEGEGDEEARRRRRRRRGRGRRRCALALLFCPSSLVACGAPEDLAQANHAFLASPIFCIATPGAHGKTSFQLPPTVLQNTVHALSDAMRPSASN